MCAAGYGLRMRVLRSLRPQLVGDVAGSVADFGVLLPIVATLVLTGGFDAGTVLVGVGALYVVAGWVFGVPVPVQPIKAAAAITIARGLPPEQLASAGLILGLILVALSLTGLTSRLAGVFAPPIVRGLQAGVGLVLLRTALKLLGAGPTIAVLVTAAVVAATLLISTGRRLPVALLLVLGGVVWTLAHDPNLTLGVGVWHPHLAIAEVDRATLWSALGLLVVPQLPLTFGNAVVGVTRLEQEYFPGRAARVTERRIGLSCGLANIAVGSLGGMPMCHGSSGLTAHVRAGATTARMNLVIGVPLLAAGLFAGPSVVPVLGLVPVAVLAGMLAFTGVMHAGLAAQLRGYPLFVATTMGVVGLATGNLAWSLLVGLALHWAPLGATALDSARSAPTPPTGA